MAALTMRNVVKRFGDVETIHGVDLDIRHKEFVVFVGPSGCGKTTLLRLIAGLESITEGDLHIGDTRANDIDASERGVAMVFQSYALYPHMSVAQNMGFGLKMSGMPAGEVRKRVDHAAQTLQLEALLDRKPKHLSGGQRQRVAIGRAIVRQPEVFLFDEPLSNLDAELRVEMRVQLQELHHKLDATMIYVTHDQVEAMTMADKIVVLRDGVIQQVGAPLELYERPCNSFVAGFIGSPRMNFIDGAVSEVGEQRLIIKLADQDQTSVVLDRTPQRPVAPGDSVSVGVRPEHLHEGHEGDTVIRVAVDVTERLGNVTFIYGRFANLERFVIQADALSPTQSGDDATVSFDTASSHVFDADGQPIL
ncbi:ABC transporter ATP-binding protein [Kushneria indalinina]|uniref:Carbohydrate ABC transporter ATP-binding protein (CUT1 family) n=1 Tax=Kushneria indalinina DSM 14324 TaxID=1122140 RepID=A0A3D9DSX9_9GAMM|nr:sn-glycerol-3-phosphate ABC transporter ATP-binding protein UgpC [Kushneria indalinina]REC93863.1 carbohydrate ABC transporter ATP-binding protein (CUT1 family) [Kushneria indalinina DSM 14324]